MKSIRILANNTARKLQDAGLLALCAAVCLWFSAMFGKIILLAQPSLTFIIVFLLTMLAMKKRKTGLLAFSGICMYTSGWLLLHTCGPLTSSLISCVGVGIWILATVIMFTSKWNASITLCQA